MPNNSIDWQSVALLAPEILLACTTMIWLMLGAFRQGKALRTVTLGCASSFVFVLYIMLHIPLGEQFGFDGMVRTNAFTFTFSSLILFSAIMAIVLAYDWLKRSITVFEYPVLMSLSVLGMLMLVKANDLIVFYMAIELMSLPLYILAAINRDNAASTEAGLKYFVLGALASGMLLFGASLVYGFSGTTRFDGIAEFLQLNTDMSPGLVVGMVLMLIAMCFKLAAAPFHMWSPDVYEGAPTPVTAFFASVPKITSLAIVLQLLLGPFASLFTEWQPIIIIIAVASMIVGAYGAITQNNIKRLLAYSAIGHVGYMMVAVATGTLAGVQAVTLYIFLYIFATVGMFACVQSLRKDGVAIESIDKLAGLSRSKPIMALLISAFLFSMAGIPPLAGFFGKMYVFLSALESGLYTLAVIGVLTSVVAAFYYIRIIKVIYFDEGEPAIDDINSASMKAVLLICALVSICFIFAPSYIIEQAGFAASALL